MAELDRKWYVVRAIGGKEKKVKDILSKMKIATLNLYVIMLARYYSD